MKENNKKYLIACDLDGTLLNNNSKLSKNTIEGIKKINKNGHYVCLVTGRPFDGSINIYKQLGLNTIMANQNGCFLSKPNDKTYVPIAIGFSKDILFEILSNKSLSNIMNNILIEGIGHAWLWKKPTNEAVAKRMTEMFHLDRGQPVDIINANFKKVKTDIATLIFEMKDSSHLNTVIYEIKNISPTLVVRSWGINPDGSMIIDVSSQFASKKTAVEYLGSYYGIPVERRVCIGDGDNDIEMLSSTIWSFALKNSTPAARIAARYMTKYDNENDGAIKQLLKFLCL